MSKGDHDQGENIADNGGSKVKYFSTLYKKSTQLYVYIKADSTAGSVPCLPKVAGSQKAMCPGIQLHFRPAFLGESR